MHLKEPTSWARSRFHEQRRIPQHVWYAVRLDLSRCSTASRHSPGFPQFVPCSQLQLPGTTISVGSTLRALIQTKYSPPMGYTPQTFHSPFIRRNLRFRLRKTFYGLKQPEEVALVVAVMMGDFAFLSIIYIRYPLLPLW